MGLLPAEESGRRGPNAQGMRTRAASLKTASLLRQNQRLLRRADVLQQVTEEMIRSTEKQMHDCRELREESQRRRGLPHPLD